MPRFNISYGSTKLKQFEIPETAPDVTGMLNRRAAAPLKAKTDQKPCEHGLFSDDSRQMDLVDMAKARNK